MIILSCGHREDNFDRHYNIMSKEWTRENKRAVGYKTVCLHCFKMYEKENLMLHSDEEADRWLSGDRS